MTNSVIEGFRQRVNDDPGLQAQFVDAYAKGPGALAALGARNGYAFTEAEAAQAIEASLDDGELSEFELGLVAGGGDPGAQDVNGVSRTPTTKQEG